MVQASSSVKTFGGLENTPLEPARVAILPAPFEGTTTYGKGTAKGPQAILDASYHMELFDEELKDEPYEAGLHTLPALDFSGKNVEEAVALVKDAITPHAQADRKTLILGGEHSITLGAVQAFAEKYPNLTVLHFDAHPDLRDEWEGSKFSHACWARRAHELGVNLIQVGIRAVSREDHEYATTNKGIHTFYAADKPRWIPNDIMQACSDNIYLSFDVDAFDSSLMPATGTPEPGGLEWWETLAVIRMVAKQFNMIGMDVVELAPIPDAHDSDFTAARLAYKMIAYAFERRVIDKHLKQEFAQRQ